MFPPLQRSTGSVAGSPEVPAVPGQCGCWGCGDRQVGMGQWHQPPSPWAASGLSADTAAPHPEAEGGGTPAAPLLPQQ